jgi:hypothetical protein
VTRNPGFPFSGSRKTLWNTISLLVIVPFGCPDEVQMRLGEGEAHPWRVNSRLPVVAVSYRPLPVTLVHSKIVLAVVQLVTPPAMVNWRGNFPPCGSMSQPFAEAADGSAVTHATMSTARTRGPIEAISVQRCSVGAGHSQENQFGECVLLRTARSDRHS